MVHSSVRLGDKIELSKKTELINSETYYSMVYELIDDLHMIIQAPIEGGRIIPLELSTVYYACVFTERGLYRGEVEVTRRMKDEKLHYLELTFLTPLKKYQRRQYYRMNCVLSFNYKDDVDSELNNWKKAIILDISGGGIRFSTKEVIDVGRVISCLLELNLRDHTIELNVSGTVLQSKEIEQEGGGFQNRIRFLDLSIEDRERIIKFIFEEERRQRKKEKGM